MRKKLWLRRSVTVVVGMLVAIATAAPVNAQAATERHGWAAVENNARHLDSVTVMHKYSNDYKNTLTWNNVSSGTKTSADLRVDYRTGVFTTGKDWWYLIAVDDEGRTYISYPHNFQWLLDKIEGAVLDWAKKVVNTYKQPKTGNYKERRKEAVKDMLAGFAVLLLNSESTAGWKQHILRSEDDRKTTTLTIRGLPGSGEQANALKISSPSGTSETNIRLFTR
ncbi:hypothetical protein [Amycolatopsis anabasis]|uniref:hypothetical protein n=1 Tax=Amycolatopsis anabasis TaxID=1840409 RepID=UPI00131C6EE8|nr:hypothetical protein [Amycolatopsis anabasis]